MCVNCDTNILNEALEILDPIFQQHGEYNTLFIINSYYEEKFADAFHHPSRYADPRQQAIFELFENEDLSQWESNTSHSPWCASMMGHPLHAPDCDCGTPFRRNAEGQS